MPKERLSFVMGFEESEVMQPCFRVDGLEPLWGGHGETELPPNEVFD